MAADLTEIFGALARGEDLTRETARQVFDDLMAGHVSEAVGAALLGAFLAKGEAVEEIVGAAEAMRAKVVKINAPENAIDTCGTGGDGISTFNVSTTAAIIAAAAGAVVAKHGNRSTTRVSGSTEALQALGIDVNCDPPTTERCLREARIGYLNARVLHPAMRHAAPIRRALPFRTMFNLLGPLTNPAGVRRQVVGVPRLDIASLLLDALKELGAEHVWVVHGNDGLCDLTITTETTVLEYRDGETNRFTVHPEDVGLEPAPLDALLVDSPAISAEAVHAILRGAPGPQRDHALLNAGAALIVAGRAGSLLESVEMAADAVDSGAALDTFHRWRSLAGQRDAALDRRHS